MSQNLTELTVNPCKMCMPMGAVTALYGISRCMSLLHGSQGCSTYIRRHMATHYNEPVDIASSSLTEHGTVFGGEENLIKGLENLIELYHPSVIGVPTTCLAETIGEDIPAIIHRFYESHPALGVTIIPIATPGYGGTQYEGFFAALRAVVSHIEMNDQKNNKVNIITGLLSPADTRYLKNLLNQTGLDYILLPDISENLDGMHSEDYDRLPSGGTPLEEIALMAGARMTIEFSAFVPSALSPAKYLKQRFGVPYVRMNMPVGLRDTDEFLHRLTLLGGVIPKDVQDERGRFVDAMIDSHKYNANGRASVFGEPDLVYAVVRLLCENGVVPVVAATGSECKGFSDLVSPEVGKAAEDAFVARFSVCDDTDFDKIERLSLELGANLLVGSSDGRRIEEKHHIRLVRCGFPIHDRIGGQRIRMLGYSGSLALLDRITNAMLEKTEHTYRGELYGKYFDAEQTRFPLQGVSMTYEPLTPALAAAKTERHPCFNCGAGKNARIHLPIAPNCNIQCNYCVRKFDCPNESRPGVTTEILSPEQAYEKYVAVKERMPNLTVVGIAGPGDALADFDRTKKTLSLIRAYDKEVVFCLSTNGLMLPLYAQELIDLGVSHVTVTMNTTDPAIGAKVYKHIDYMGTRYTAETGAAVLLANQLSGLRYLTARGVVCKVNIVVLKGINDHHIEEVVKTVKDVGVAITNIMQLIPVAGSAFESLPLVSNKEITTLRKTCEGHIKQMYHCRQCRADAVGTLNNDLSIEYRGCNGCGDKEKEKKEQSAPLKTFAVASRSGILVDQHFGHAEEFFIYESDGELVRFKEKRPVAKYCTGAENCEDKTGKMEDILYTVSDCDGVLALRIGVSPSEKLSEKGIRIFTTYDRIEDAVRNAAKEWVGQVPLQGA